MAKVIPFPATAPAPAPHEGGGAARGQIGYKFEHLTLVGRHEDGCCLWACSCGTRGKRIELKYVRPDRRDNVSCGCVGRELFKGHYENLVEGLSADTRREAFRLIGAGKVESTYGWQQAAARELKTRRQSVDTCVLSFAAHSHRAKFISESGEDGLAAIARTAQGSSRGFSNLVRRGLNRAEVFLAIRETRKSHVEKAAAEAEERRIDREQLSAELSDLMTKIEDPELRDLGAEQLADELIEKLHEVADRVHLVVGSWGPNRVELPSPGSKAFEKSKKALVWVHKLLAALSEDDRSAYMQLSKLWRTMVDSLRQRELRRQSLVGLMRLGLMPESVGWRPTDRLGLGRAPKGFRPEIAAELFSYSLNVDLPMAA